MHIRPLRADEEEFLDEMLYLALWLPSSALPFPRSITRSPELSPYVCAWGSLSGDAGFVAESSPAVRVGAVWLRCIPPPGGYGFWRAGVPELSMAVIPSLRNHGIGSELLSTALAHAQSSFPAVSLSVAAENPARRLYERFGFTARERRGDSIVMVREL